MFDSRQNRLPSTVGLLQRLRLYDHSGERLHTIYIGASPEYGKSRFLQRMQREVEIVQENYPNAYRIGLADGAADNWRFLEPHTDGQLIDYYHATEYLAQAAKAAHPRSLADRQQWLQQRCDDLKHKKGAASRILQELRSLSRKKLSRANRESLQAAMTYFANHKHQMHYSRHIAAHRPIGSKVTEAACKTLVKQRLGRSGMRWREPGARVVLSLRSLVMTADRWRQFWQKIDQYGLTLAIYSATFGLEQIIGRL